MMVGFLGYADRLLQGMFDDVAAGRYRPGPHGLSKNAFMGRRADSRAACAL